MSTGSSKDDDTPLGLTEAQALRRLAEPPAQRALPEPEDLWAHRYRILEAIGHGGMGDVFLARDVVLERLVALKVLRSTSDESFVDERRLLREARAAARAEHERIARVYDAGTWKEQAFIAMEYVRGETLRAWMKTHRPTTNEIIAIIQQLLEGLQALHDRGLIHRDVKPENVMVTPDGNLRILDLGVARRVVIPDSTTAMVDAPGSLSLGFGVGTPGYMAPEQWRHGEIDARADLFALGVIGYELVAARAPFRGSTNLKIREQTLHGELDFDEPEWSSIPAALKSAIERALSRDATQRFENVAAMADMLAPLFRPTLPPLSRRGAPSIRPPGEDALRSESLGASAVGMSVRTPAPVTKRRRPAWAFVAGAMTAVAAFGAAAYRLRAKTATLPPPTAGMVRLAGGSYNMGLDAEHLASMCATYSNGCPPEAQKETPLRPTTVAPFELDVREVTNEEFAAFLTSIGSLIRVLDDDDSHYPRFVRYALRPGEDLLLYDLWKDGAGIEFEGSGRFQARAGFERLPVTLVTWLGARLHCKSTGKRLPTEAEWEFAARGVEGRPYPWGSAPPNCDGVHIPSNKILALLNPERCDNERITPYPVMTASQDVTPDGLYDVGGNVAEWVDDDANVNDDEATYANRLKAESPGVVRGGAYNSSFYTRTTARGFWMSLNVAANIGFRCAK